MVYEDVDYNGIITGDPPWTVPPQAQPVTINIYQGTYGGTPYGTALTVPADTMSLVGGSYQYPDDPGDAPLVDLGGGTTYYIEAVPPGAFITAGANPDTFTVVDGVVVTTGMLFIDDFDVPNPFDSYAIIDWPPAPVPPPPPPLYRDNPLTLPSWNPGDEFADRELWVNVTNPVSPVRAAGTIGTMASGDGLYTFGGADSTQARLTYDDGAIHDLVTLAGNQGFRIEFDWMQVPSPGPGLVGSIEYTITVTDAAARTVTPPPYRVFQYSDGTVPFSEYRPFTDFTNIDPLLDFTQVDSVVLLMNSGGVDPVVPGVDFAIDAILAANAARGPDYAAAWLSKTIFMSGIGWDPFPLPPGPIPPEGITESGVVMFEGTEGNDRFEFVAAETLDGSVLTVNGVAVAVDPSVSTLSFDGLGGEDTVILTGSAGDETLELWANAGVLIGESWAVNFAAVESVEADGGGGNDTANLYDSPGDDMLVTAPRYARLTGDGFSVKATSFNSINAFATAGGHDTARIYDSPGDDILRATPTETALYRDGAGDGVSNLVRYFEEVHAFAPAGGYDIAMLFDSENDDTFYASPVEGGMQGDGYVNRVRQFEEIRGDASLGGHDVAELFDSEEDDVFRGSLGEAVLSGATYCNQAKFFDSVEADASGGGEDRAWLFDSLGDDHLTASDDWALLSFGLSDISIGGFDWVEASSTKGGNDTKHVEMIDFLFQFDGLWTDV